jgi:hypothetical protein
MNAPTMTPHQQAVALVAAAYPTPAWAPATLRAYAKMLEDIDAALLQSVVEAWLRTKAERPSIADLRRAAAAKQAAASPSPYLDPDQAWAHVEWALIHIGSYDRFPDTHPLVAETVKAMGWMRLCRSDNGVADRAHFLQLYRARLERAKAEDAARPGAVPIAAMGEQRQVPQRQQPRQVEDQRATKADAQALVAAVTQSIGPRALPAPPQVVDAPESPTIGDDGLIAAREERRRTMLAELAERNGGRS